MTVGYPVTAVRRDKQGGAGVSPNEGRRSRTLSLAPCIPDPDWP